MLPLLGSIVNLFGVHDTIGCCGFICSTRSEQLHCRDVSSASKGAPCGLKSSFQGVNLDIQRKLLIFQLAISARGYPLLGVLSVLIVNWNTRDLLLACLASLQRFPPKEDHEVIVVDNASTDGSADAIRSAFPDVKLVQQERNLGYAAGNNAAFAVATGEWLLTLNPDTELTEPILDEAIAILQANPKAGALGIKLVGQDGHVQRSVRGFPTFLGIFGDLTGLARLFPRTNLGSYRLPAFDYELEQPAPQPMGTFLLFRRSALEAVGDPRKPFDEGFPIFFNEVDLLFRMSRAGWYTLYTPRVKIKHWGGESTRQVRKSMIWESHKSLLRFFRKHYRTPLNAPLLALLSLVVYAGAFVRARGYHAGFRR
jgi:GT2 family glycosyltransferase